METLVSSAETLVSSYGNVVSIAETLVSTAEVFVSRQETMAFHLNYPDRDEGEKELGVKKRLPSPNRRGGSCLELYTYVFY